MNQSIQLTSIFIYPIKSTTGIQLFNSEVQKRGLLFDRRLALVNSKNKVMTAREYPQLLGITSTIESDHLAVNGGEVKIPFKTEKTVQEQIQIFSSRISGIPLHEEYDEWFSDFLDEDCRLFFTNESVHREVLEKNGGSPGDEFSFADQAPILLLSEESMADLNNRLEDKITASRFRPNFVISGCEANEEDTWQQVQIGECLFDVIQTCKRCIFTTIDPLTYQKHEKQEPLRTLATYRPHPKGGVRFGVHLVPRKTGVVKHGDEVKIVK